MTTTTDHHDLAATVASNVRAAMRSRGLSGVAMAKAMGMPQQSWSRRERGQTPLTVDELWLVAEILDRDPGSFFAPEPPRYTGPALRSARSSMDRASDYGSVVRYMPPLKKWVTDSVRACA